MGGFPLFLRRKASDPEGESEAESRIDGDGQVATIETRRGADGELAFRVTFTRLSPEQLASNEPLGRSCTPSTNDAFLEKFKATQAMLLSVAFAEIPERRW